MEGVYIAIAIGIGILGFVWYTVAQGNAKARDMAGYLATTARQVHPVFTISDSCHSGIAAIGYDVNQQKLLLANRNGDHFSSLLVDSEMIVEVKIYDNGSVVAQSSGGLVGGVVGGVGLGAIGKRKNQVSLDVSLQIVLNTSELPSWSITFLMLHQTDASTASIQRRQALDQAQKWYGIVASVAGSNKSVSSPSPEVNAQSLPAGQEVSALKELVQLHERGLLSSEEFQSAKKRLLGLG